MVGVLVVMLCLSIVGTAVAATPEPSILGVGDPRSEGEGPGLVGSPVLIALAVAALGLVAAATTLIAVRMMGED